MLHRIAISLWALIMWHWRDSWFPSVDSQYWQLNFTGVCSFTCCCRRLKLAKTRPHNSQGNGSMGEGFSCFVWTWSFKVLTSIKFISHSSQTFLLPCFCFKCLSSSDLFPLNLHFGQLEQTSLLTIWISSCLLLCLSLLSKWTFSKWIFNSSRFFDWRLQKGQVTQSVFTNWLFLGCSSMLTDAVGDVGLCSLAMWNLRLLWWWWWWGGRSCSRPLSLPYLCFQNSKLSSNSKELSHNQPWKSFYIFALNNKYK